MSAPKETISGWGIAGLSVLAALLLYVGGYFAFASYCARNLEYRRAEYWSARLYGRLPRPVRLFVFGVWCRVDPHGEDLLKP